MKSTPAHALPRTPAHMFGTWKHACLPTTCHACVHAWPTISRPAPALRGTYAQAWHMVCTPAHAACLRTCLSDDKPPAHALRGKPGHMHTCSRACCAHLLACLAREKRRQTCARTTSHACARASRMKSARFTAGAELCKVTATFLHDQA